MAKFDVYKLILENGVYFKTTEHPAWFSDEDVKDVELLYPDRVAKNLFVRDDKKENYYLITVLSEKRVDLKEFKEKFGLRKLTFASPEDLEKYLDIKPGSVSPFCLMNDKELKVTFYLDKNFVGGKIGVHPNDNTSTVWLTTKDLIYLVGLDGHKVNVVEV